MVADHTLVTPSELSVANPVRVPINSSVATPPEGMADLIITPLRGGLCLLPGTPNLTSYGHIEPFEIDHHRHAVDATGYPLIRRERALIDDLSHGDA